MRMRSMSDTLVLPHTMTNQNRRRLRSEIWFNDMSEPGETAVYLERFNNYGITRAELQSGKPVIGIAQTGNDLTPCNRTTSSSRRE